MNLFQLSHNIAGAKLLPYNTQSESKTFSHLATDSRSIANPADTIFATVQTAVADGHRYIPSLISKGVEAFIVERVPEGCDGRASFIIVPSVEKALADIARTKLEGFEGGIVVTGSYGKTKMKELLYRALLPFKKVRRSPRSWNSAIGLPLSIWDMTRTEPMPEIMITEAAIDGPKQGFTIANIIGKSHPTGIITGISEEHDDAFDSHRDKIREKIAILTGCKTIYFNDCDAILKEELEALSSRTGVRSVPIKTENGRDIFHVIADRVLCDMELKNDELDTIPLCNTRITISSSVNGCKLIRDSFTPDLRTLEGTLDFLRRHPDANRSDMLLLGDLIDTDSKRITDLGVPIIHASEPLPALHNKQILAFGTEDSLRESLKALEAPTHDTTLEVDLDAVLYNYNYYRRLLPAGTGMVAMVKASAYGLGAVEIGRTLQQAGAAYLAVAVIEEAIALRDAGITTPIMVLNPITNRHAALFEHRIEPAVFSIEELRTLIREVEAFGVSEYPVHIKLDTGMHRVGFTPVQLPELIETLKSQNAVKVKSVFSHLATADCLDKDDYTNGQIETFTSACDTIEKELGHKFLRHILNTAGMMRFADACRYDMARLGIGLYGILPYSQSAPSSLKPVASFRTHIISLKHWPAGTPIGYGGRGVTERESIIATIPVGYADGINRHLGRGAGKFVIGGVECPTIGNICMDQCMVDVSDVPDVAVGDTVEIFGRQMPIERLAEALDTIPYEILTSVSPRVSRTYIKR